MPRFGSIDVPVASLLEWLGIDTNVHVIHIYQDNDRSQLRVVVEDPTLPEVTGNILLQQEEHFPFTRLPTVSTGELPKFTGRGGGQGQGGR